LVVEQRVYLEEVSLSDLEAMAASKAANIIESALKNSMQPVSVEEITGACRSLAQFVCDKKNWFVFCFFLFFFFACLYFDYRKYIIFFF
jgi:hypothetical protein